MKLVFEAGKTLRHEKAAPEQEVVGNDVSNMHKAGAWHKELCRRYPVVDVAKLWSGKRIMVTIK